ncbi:hypothetical protein [Criblamydia sequanensis]|uniref:Uncharacterized protein n=1 Tax=Candidatus Criblamydia sequanensis CRIB-18 TaxID=1437425 RepID=A0A090D297_9BACT|nr:hypothetical protein [Criblamydia sequanensis]CDR34158.1 hypothetical protein CSEC_1338 [Criblamydia sequanensis CRIB-18]
MQVPDNSHLPPSSSSNNSERRNQQTTSPQLNSYLGRVVTELSANDIEDNGGSSIVNASLFNQAMIYTCCGRTEDLEVIKRYEQDKKGKVCIFCRNKEYNLVPNRDMQNVIDAAKAKEKAKNNQETDQAPKDPVEILIDQIAVKMLENPVAALEFCYNCWETYEDNPKLIDIKDSILETLRNRYKTEKDTLFGLLLEFEDKICVKALETFRHDLTKLFDNEHKSEADHLSRRQSQAQTPQATIFTIRLGSGKEGIFQGIEEIYKSYSEDPTPCVRISTQRATNFINDLLRVSAEKINSSPIGQSLTLVLEASLNYCYTSTNTVPLGFIQTIGILISQSLSTNVSPQTNMLRISRLDPTQTLSLQRQIQSQQPLGQGPQRFAQAQRTQPSRPQQPTIRPSPSPLTHPIPSGRQYQGMAVTQTPRPQQYPGMPPQTPRPQQYPGMPVPQPRPQQRGRVPVTQTPRDQQYTGVPQPFFTTQPQQYPVMPQYPDMPPLPQPPRQQGSGNAQTLPQGYRPTSTPTHGRPLPSQSMQYQNHQHVITSNTQETTSSLQNVPFLRSVPALENGSFSSSPYATDELRSIHSPLIRAMLTSDNPPVPSSRQAAREDLYAGEEPEEKENDDDIDPDSFFSDFINPNEDTPASSTTSTTSTTSTSSTPQASQTPNQKLILKMYEDLANLTSAVDALATETISGGERKRKHDDSNRESEVIDLASSEKETETASDEKDEESLVPKRRRQDQAAPPSTTLFLDDEEEEEVASGNVSSLDLVAMDEASTIPGIFIGPPPPTSTSQYATSKKLVAGYDVEPIFRAIDHVSFRDYKAAIALIPKEHLPVVFTTKVNLTYVNMALINYVFTQPASQKKHTDIRKIALHMLKMGVPLTEEILLTKPNKVYWKNSFFVEKAKEAGLLKYNPYNKKK